jgi:hypothetical protein
MDSDSCQILLLRLDGANLHIQIFQFGAEEETGLPLVDKSKCNHVIPLFCPNKAPAGGLCPRLTERLSSNRSNVSEIPLPNEYTINNPKELAILFQFLSKFSYVNFVVKLQPNDF